MGSSKLFDDGFAVVRREESKAHNEMDYYERIAKGQQTQMDALLTHKDECVMGIAHAKKTGLTAVHIREFELLMSHIDLTVETLSYKVEKSLANSKKAKETWLQKSKIFNDLKEEIKQKELEREQELIGGSADERESANTEEDIFGHKIVKFSDNEKWYTSE